MQKSSSAIYPSPLDGAMSRFLDLLRSTSSAPTHLQLLEAIATGMDVPTSFVEGLFLSARRRGLVQGEQRRGKGRITWSLTRSGEALITRSGGIPQEILTSSD